MLRKITIIGNVCADATVKDINNRLSIQFNVAVNEKYKDKTNNNWIEKATFYSCNLWRDKGADNISQHILKGVKVYVESSLFEPYSYTSKDNVQVHSIRMNVNEFKLLSKSEPKNPLENTEALFGKQQQNADQKQVKQPANNEAAKKEEDNDDLPF